MIQMTQFFCEFLTRMAAVALTAHHSASNPQNLCFCTCQLCGTVLYFYLCCCKYLAIWWCTSFEGNFGSTIPWIDGQWSMVNGQPCSHNDTISVLCVSDFLFFFFQGKKHLKKKKKKTVNE